MPPSHPQHQPQPRLHPQRQPTGRKHTPDDACFRSWSRKQAAALNLLSRAAWASPRTGVSPLLSSHSLCCAGPLGDGSHSKPRASHHSPCHPGKEHGAQRGEVTQGECTQGVLGSVVVNNHSPSATPTTGHAGVGVSGRAKSLSPGSWEPEEGLAGDGFHVLRS